MGVVWLDVCIVLEMVGKVGVLLLGAVQGHLMECRYSAVSGLVAEVVIGAQKIQVGLNFLSSDSFVYSLEECPPFVSRCFSSGQSATLVDLDIVKQLADQDVTLSGKLMTDIVNRPDGVLVIQEPVVFVLVFSSSPRSLLFRDVAGAIGFGKHSGLLASRVISLSESDDGIVTVSDIQRTVVMLDASVDSSSASRWDFQAQLQVGPNISISTVVVFDPVEQDIVIPIEYMNDIVRAFARDSVVKVREDHRLFMVCKSGFQLPNWFRLTLFVSQSFVEIPQRLYQQSEGQVWMHGSIPFCPLRIRFSLTSSVVVIGRALIRSVSQLILNYKSRKLGFVFRSTEAVSFESPEISLPGFHLKDYLVDLFPSIEIPMVSSRSNFYLLSAFEMPESVGVVCWGFAAGGRYMAPPLTSETEFVDGVFTKAQVRLNAAGTVQIHLEDESNVLGNAGKMYRLFVTSDPQRITFCRELYTDEPVRGVSITPLAPERYMFPEEEPTRRRCSAIVSSIRRFFCWSRRRQTRRRVSPGSPGVSLEYNDQTS